MILNKNLKKSSIYLFNYWYFVFLKYKNKNLKYFNNIKFLRYNNTSSFYVYKFFNNINKQLLVSNTNLLIKNSNSSTIKTTPLSNIINSKYYFKIIFIFNSEWVKNFSFIVINTCLSIYMYFIKNVISMHNRYINNEFNNNIFNLLTSEQFKYEHNNLNLRRFLRYKFNYKRRRFRYRKYVNKFKLNYK